MPGSSRDILERFRTGYGKDMDVTLRPAYRDLLAAFGNPQNKLPPVFHVAGTNGKGSTCAFLRGILEAAGYKTHVYTSPHLVSVHERFRVAGELISETELAGILGECEAAARPGQVSYFEAATAAAFIAFSRHAADFTILEVGLGGRLDATNVVEKPLATLIARLSLDHRDILGDSIDKIASEKAGIMRAGVPCFVSAQPDAAAAQVLRECANEIGARLLMENTDWQVAENEDGFRLTQGARVLDLSAPALPGRHQYHNAALAIAALSVLPQVLPRERVAAGLRNVEWPARLQRLSGRLAALVPPGAELWLDGGHNDSAGEVLGDQIARWEQTDPKPLCVILGMLTSKHPGEFLAPFAGRIARLRAVAVPGEALSFNATDLAGAACRAGVADAAAAPDIRAAIEGAAQGFPRPRLLICGSLYLAGKILEANG